MERYVLRRKTNETKYRCLLYFADYVLSIPFCVFYFLFVGLRVLILTSFILNISTVYFIVSCLILQKTHVSEAQFKNGTTNNIMTIKSMCRSPFIVANSTYIYQRTCLHTCLVDQHPYYFIVSNHGSTTQTEDWSDSDINTSSSSADLSSRCPGCNIINWAVYERNSGC